MRGIQVWRHVTTETFREIRAAGEPALLPGLVEHWPLVAAARQGDRACADYLRRFALPKPVQYARAGAEVEGRLHYGERLNGRNFRQETGTLAEFLDLLLAEADAARPDVVVLQGLAASDHLANFADANNVSLLPTSIIPRVWIGNAAKIATHHDPTENIACVAAGRRRFTLFSPEQVGNLYMGPFHPTPAGVQVSMAHVTAPDLDRYPRFAEALGQAQQAEIGPGDALYIPYHWYHHVEALDRFNVLVNYWWDAARTDIGSPWDAFLHGMISLRTLPPDQRRAWRAMFNHYVFLADGDPGAHLAPEARGILDAGSPRDIAQMRHNLLTNLQRSARRG